MAFLLLGTLGLAAAANPQNQETTDDKKEQDYSHFASLLASVLLVSFSPESVGLTIRVEEQGC